MVYRIGDGGRNSIDSPVGAIARQQSFGFPRYDSMSSASPKQVQEKDAQKASVFQSIFTWVKEQIFRIKTEEKIESVSKSASATDHKNSHPQLPPPEDITMQQLSQCLKEMSEDLIKFQELMHEDFVVETNPNRAEALYHLLALKHIINGLKIKDMLIWDAKEATFKRIEDNKQLQEEKLKFLNYFEDCIKTHNTTGKVNFVIDVALVTMGIATFAAVVVTVATGGTAAAGFAAVTAILLPFEGTASVAKGLSSAYQGWVRHKMERTKGDIGDVSFKMEVNSEKTKTLRDGWSSGEKSVHDLWKSISRMENARSDTLIQAINLKT